MMASGADGFSNTCCTITLVIIGIEQGLRTCAGRRPQWHVQARHQFPEARIDDTPVGGLFAFDADEQPLSGTGMRGSGQREEQRGARDVLEHGSLPKDDGHRRLAGIEWLCCRRPRR